MKMLFGSKNDSAERLEEYTLRAKKGDISAVVSVAVILMNSKSRKKRNKAARLLESAVGHDYPPAYYYLAQMYETGRGLSRNMKNAIELYETAAEKGFVRASLRLGDLYERGEVVKRDYDTAVEYYRKAIKGGDGDAFYCMSLMYKKGHGVEKSHMKYMDLLRDGANHGSPRCNYILGTFYYKGNEYSQNLEKAKAYFLKCAASGKGDLSLKAARLAAKINKKLGTSRL